MGNIPRPPIYRIPLIQLAVLVPLSATALLVDTTAAYSLLLGGLIHLLPNIYFAVQTFRFQGAKAMRQTLSAMAKGEILKFLLVVIGFALVFVFVKPFNLAALFGAYIAMTLVHAIATTRLIVK